MLLRLPGTLFDTIFVFDSISNESKPKKSCLPQFLTREQNKKSASTLLCDHLLKKPMSILAKRNKLCYTSFFIPSFIHSFTNLSLDRTNQMVDSFNPLYGYE
jgi:hypothetical protein